ncbi:hypothetical protein [Methylobacterium gregans]|uniref:hypothetical protein n=1 Tax=Methylobacterium gregans TaxID=374424 RepID=UPI0036063987
MQIDLATLWYLTIGTLLVSAALTLWERQAHPGARASSGSGRAPARSSRSAAWSR